MHELRVMNPAALSTVSCSSTDVPTTRSRAHCTQHLQPVRQFGCGCLRLSTRQLQRSRKHKFDTCFVAAVEAPSAASSSGKLDASEELNTQDLYKRFEQLLGQYSYSYKQGDKVKGIVFRVDQRGAYVDIGAKAAATCPSEECSLVGVQRATQVLKVDDEREFIVVRDEYKGGEIRLSLRKIEEEICWKRVAQLQEENVTVIGKVVSINKGGLMVEVENLRGFVPMSQIPNVDNVDDLMDKNMPVKFLEIDQERERLVFSARKAADSKQLKTYSIGDVAEGVIQSIKPYGAFVDLGKGMSGLLHISQISFDRITNVGSILSEGDKLKVMILSQDKDRGRMSLSTKKLEPTPGDMLRDPQKVYERADEMAKAFQERLAQAEATARAEGVQF